MPNSTTHFGAGVITAVLLFIVFSQFHYSRMLLFLGAIFCVMAAEFPDIDQGNSIPRKVMRHLLPGVVVALIVYLFFYWSMWSRTVGELLLFLIVPAIFLFSYEKFIPAHRREIHQLPGLAIVIVLMIAVGAFLRLNFLETTILSACAGLGFISHIALDHLM